MPKEERVKNHTLSIGTILSNRTKEGMVEFQIDDHKMQWDIPKAKEIYGMLGGAIEAAVSDTLIWKFFTDEFGLDEDRAAMILAKFREIRQGTRGTVFPF